MRSFDVARVLEGLPVASLWVLVAGPTGSNRAVWTRGNLLHEGAMAANLRIAGKKCYTKAKEGSTMLQIDATRKCQTVMTTFECSPGACADLLETLTSAYEEFISKQSGFIAAGLHVNDAQTRIANYSQWERREDFQAMLRSNEMRRRNREIANLCTRFEPVMYEVAGVF
jgi:heme-degrading monooxygenase HmoA